MSRSLLWQHVHPRIHISETNIKENAVVGRNKVLASYVCKEKSFQQKWNSLATTSNTERSILFWILLLCHLKSWSEFALSVTAWFRWFSKNEESHLATSQLSRHWKWCHHFRVKYWILFFMLNPKRKGYLVLGTGSKTNPDSLNSQFWPFFLHFMQIFKVKCSVFSHIWQIIIFLVQ